MTSTGTTARASGLRSRLRAWMQPPTFADAERTRSAYVLHWLFLLGLLAVVAQITVATLTYDDPSAAWTFNGPLALGMFFFLIMLHRGYVWTATLAVSAFAWTSVISHMALRGGIQSHALPGLLIVTFFVGFVWSARAAVVVAIGSTLALAAVAWALEAGVLGSSTQPSPLQVVVTFAVCLMITTVFVWLAQRAVENALDETRKSERKYAQLVERAPLGVMVIDRHLGVTQANAAALQIIGASGVDEIVGRSDSPAPIWRHDSRLREAILGCIQRGEDSELELSGTTRFGRFVRVRLYVAPLPEPDGTISGCIIVFEDVAKQRDLEERLAQSNKLEALGRLAGGIAHDFNNILTVVSGFSESAHARLADRPEERADLEQVIEAAQHAAGLTRQLLAFSRKQVIQPRVFDLNEVLGSLETMLRRLIGEDVDLVLDLCPEPVTIRADPGQIEQVALNLVVNGRDAMPDGGTLRISTRSRANGPDDGGHVSMTVEDSGVGMDSETLQRIFDPFFTTKDQGKGTGLGLATVYGIVQQSGGELRVQSKPGEGTRFEVLLPRCDRTQEEGIRADRIASEERSEPALVLIAEDETALLKLARKILERAGHRTLTARDGVEAVSVAAENPGRIDVLVTDVVMPRMGGVELAAELRRDDPGLPVVFMSGHTDHPGLSAGPLPERTEFLAKPFQTAELVAAVARSVGRRRTEAG